MIVFPSLLFFAHVSFCTAGISLVTPLETLSLHFSSVPSPTLPRDEAAALALALPSLPLLHCYPPSAPRHRSLGRLERRNCIPFLLPTLHFYRERVALQGAPSLPIELATTPATLNEITGRVVEAKILQRAYQR